MQTYLGIDAGTQGLAVVLTDQQMNVLATGDGHYDMIPDLADGCYEQQPGDWESALVSAMNDLRNNFQDEFTVMAIGISGQMHGEVLIDANNDCLGPARLWCDARNDDEGEELTDLFGVKMPKRITSARWLWTIRNRNQIAANTQRITTPSGWIAHRLTGEWNLGIGDAAGMFPIDQATQNYDESLLNKFRDSFGQDSITDLSKLLPAVRVAGQPAGSLNEHGASLLGLPSGIPVAAAEGDQPAAMAGSLIGEAGMVSVSFGTSVCANSIGDRSFNGVSQAVDHFCAADGKPINMVWLRNGTTYMNCLVEMFGKALPAGQDPFANLMPQVIDAPADCGGLLALPFMDDEPGLGVLHGGKASIIGLNESNATPGNVIKAALLATMFNLKLGSEVLDLQGFPRTELILTGGLTRTPQLAQILSDLFETPVTLLESAAEGTAWGAALLAKFRHLNQDNQQTNWPEFLSDSQTGNRKRFTPDSNSSQVYQQVFKSYTELLKRD